MKNIYLMGICGTGMGNFALMLKEAGYNVSGSDINIYPPMSTKLLSAGVKIYEGYKVDNLKDKDIDLVIIGNVIRKDNAEAVYVINNNIKHLSMPEGLKEFFFKNKESIVITGTHGKTSTSFLISWILEAANLNPSYFIGGIPLNFSNEMGRNTNSKYFVIEGDEYDTVFYDKVPKFNHYNTKYLIINGIEFDHADIYSNLDSIISAFLYLVKQIPEDGLIVYNADDINVLKIIDYAKCKTLGFSKSNKEADYYLKEHKIVKQSQEFTLSSKYETRNFNLNLPGFHNILNSISSIILADFLNIDNNILSTAISTFKGVKRRLEVYSVSNNRTIIDDFAHHPTAIKYTIDAVNSWYVNKNIWCVFEPRTATTRTNILEKELIEAFMSAKNVLFAPIHEPNRVSIDKRLDLDKVCNILSSNNINVSCFKDTVDIIAYLKANVKEDEIILIMSNGGFNNIYAKLDAAFKER